MRICRTIGIGARLLTCAALLALSGCGNTAVYLRGGAVGVIEKPVTVVAAVPGEDGKLVPHTKLELPAGTEFKYGK